jgi:large subunit ribosomal protein L25
MGASYELSATVREKVGKGAARSVRRLGMVPAVIYGGKQPPVAINLPDREVYFKIHGGGFFTTVATIDVAGQKIRAIPRDYQIDPVTDRPMHVDFLRVVEGSRLTVEVPVQFVNEGAAPGIRRGGVLNVVRHRISVDCLADQIPEKIVVDLTGLDINDSLHISAVSMPEGVNPTIKRDFTIATIAAPAGVKEEMKAQAEAAAAAKVAAAAAAEAGIEGAPAEAGAEAKPAAGAPEAAAPAGGKTEGTKKG